MSMSNTDPNLETRIALFQRKEVRRTIHNNEWWFAIADVVAVLTDSVAPGGLPQETSQTRSFPRRGVPRGGDNLSPPWP